MTAGLPSDEVADDYKNSLEDLINNDRYQIGNLTVIARENIEYAEAISRVLQNHIQRTPPARKLPALYVLDSIVKNVGTPYTIYFARNLRSIFMGAYSSVDNNVRIKLDEMLDTWRKPVPGSLSPALVFPLHSTQNIVDTLNEWRNNTGNQTRPQQMHILPGRVSQPQAYRSTPTPPQGIPGYPSQAHSQIGQQPSHNAYSTTVQNNPLSQYSQQGHPQPQPQSQTLSPYEQHRSQQQYPTPHQQAQYQPPTPVPRPTSSVDLAKLHADIDDLTIDAKIEASTHPMDQTAKSKLVSLQSLKDILDHGNLSEADIVSVRDSIFQQMAKKLAPHRPTPPLVPQYRQAIPSPAHYPPSQNVYQAPPHVSLPAAPSFINSASLSALIQATANRNSPAPQLLQPTVGTPPPNHAVPSPSIGENPLIAQLRASGLLSGTPTPGQSIPTTSQSLSGTATPNSFTVEVKFTSASIKISRPHLVTSFLSARPNQCSTCGRRFRPDEDGREKKSRHLDWHFKTKTRMVEAEKRGYNRSWYVDEREWIASREYEDEAGPADENGGDNGLRSASASDSRQAFVRVPDDPALKNAPCPIDQERFESTWSHDLQDFIWKDAIKVGNKYFHASCYKEAMKAKEMDVGSATPIGAGMRTGTPDSVLGKRKAEEEANGVKSRIKAELVH